MVALVPEPLEGSSPVITLLFLQKASVSGRLLQQPRMCDIPAGQDNDRPRQRADRVPIIILATCLPRTRGQENGEMQPPGRRVVALARLRRLTEELPAPSGWSPA